MLSSLEEAPAKNLPTKPADTCRHILLDPQTANPHAAFQPEQMNERCHRYHSHRLQWCLPASGLPQKSHEGMLGT